MIHSHPVEERNFGFRAIIAKKKLPSIVFQYRWLQGIQYLSNPKNLFLHKISIITTVAYDLKSGVSNMW